MVQKFWAGFKELCVEGAEEDQPQHPAEAKGRGVAGWAHTTAQGMLVPSTGVGITAHTSRRRKFHVIRP